MTPKNFRPGRRRDGLAFRAGERSQGDIAPSTSSTIKRRADTTWSQKPKRTTTNQGDTRIASTQREGRKGGLVSFSLENGEVVRSGDKKNCPAFWRFRKKNFDVDAGSAINW